MERVEGIEPSYEAWKATALPLSYTRKSTTWPPIALDFYSAFAALSAKRSPLPRPCGLGQRSGGGIQQRRLAPALPRPAISRRDGCQSGAQLQTSPGRPILYGPDRVDKGRPFQLSRTNPSRTSPSTAVCTAGIAPRQSGAMARATSLGQIVASGVRRASRDSTAALGSVICVTSAPHAIRSSRCSRPESELANNGIPTLTHAAAERMDAPSTRDDPLCSAAARHWLPASPLAC